MADWNLPTISSPYGDVPGLLRDLAIDAAKLFLDEPTNPIAGMVKLVRSPVKFQARSASTWDDLVLSIEGGGTGASTLAGIVTNLGLKTMAFQDSNAVSISGGTLAGNGAGLTDLNATNITAGTLADARLSSNVPLKNVSNTFTARQIVSMSTTNVVGVQVNNGTTAQNTAPTFRARAYSPSYELMDKDSVQNWYFGLADDDGDAAYIGRGYGPGQAIGPAIKILTSDVVVFPGGVGGAGVLVGNPTGGNKGTGTINVSGGIYLNNTAYTNPDYVFERAFTGRIERCGEREGAAEYVGRLSLDELRAHVSTHFQLPGVAHAAEIFRRSDVLLEKLEEAYLYIFELHDRLTALESERRASVR